MQFLKLRSNQRTELLLEASKPMKLTQTPLSAACILVVWLVTPCVRADVTLTTLVSLAGTNGSHPYAGLVQGSDGNFYGTSFDGGPTQGGTVFKVTPDGTLTTLYSFNAGNEGDLPACGLARGSGGNLYGTSGFDGAQGHGAVFQIAPDGAFSIIGPVPATVSLDSGDGLNSVVQGTNGSLYVTAGALSGYNDYGSIFEMALDGTFKTLYSFTGGGDGDEPSYAGLVQGTDGNFYGATSYGGASGHGTVFSLTPTGTLTTLVSFTGTNGASPGDMPFALLQGKDGNFYGTTEQRGAYGHGTVFEMTPAGALTTLVSFNGTNGDWVHGLMQGTNGNLYGTTEGGGPGDYGTVFELSLSGALTTLCSFSHTNGEWPVGLVQGTDGQLYGTTTYGGQYRIYGTVFRLSLTPTAPRILSATNSGGIFALRWSAEAGRSYQVQFSTGLAQTNWAALGGTLTATGTTATASDTIGPDPQRFYRVVLLP
jgi:uncharacterized repeat protein (TIGR03803 family)